MKIRVTQQDIDRGIRFDACHCPVALAVQRKLKVHASHDIHVGRVPGVPTLEGWNAFITAFDNGDHVKPTTLDNPQLDGWTPSNYLSKARNSYVAR